MKSVLLKKSKLINKLKKHSWLSRFGFTVMEITVITAIIGLMTSLVFLGLRSLNFKTRDVRRMGDVRSLQLALSLYKSENGFYPAANAIISGSPLISPTGKTYLAKIPAGILDSVCNTPFNYQPASGSLSYYISYCLATQSNGFGPGNCVATPGSLCCIPTCTNVKNCGDDGCGGFCGLNTCMAGGMCVAGQCVADCSKGGVFGASCPDGSTTIGCKCAGGLAYAVNSNAQFVVAKNDQDSVVQATGLAWGCSGTSILGANNTTIGTGYQNTANILAGCAEQNTAARYCDNLVSNGYSDWYLPSKDELKALYDNRIAYGINANNKYYWTSTQGSATTAYRQKFGVVMTEDAPIKTTLADVVCVRSDLSKPSFMDYATASASLATVCQGNQITLNIAGTYNLNTGDHFAWYRGGCGIISSVSTQPIGYGSSLSHTPGITDQNIYLAETYYVRIEDSNNAAKTSCISTSEVTINPAPRIKEEYIVNKEECNPGSVALAVINPNLVYATPFSNVEWYDAPTGGNLLATGFTYATPSLKAGESGNYYVAGVSPSGCRSVVRTQVSAHIVDANEVIEPPKVVKDSHYCVSTVGAFQRGRALAYSQHGYDIKWYASETGGVALATGSDYEINSIQAATDFWAEAVSKCGKVSARTKVSVTGVAIPPTNSTNLWVSIVANRAGLTSMWGINPYSSLRPGADGPYLVVALDRTIGSGNNRLYFVSQGSPSYTGFFPGKKFSEEQTFGNGILYTQPLTVARINNVSYTSPYVYLNGYYAKKPRPEIILNVPCGKTGYYVWMIDGNDYCYNTTRPAMNPKGNISTGACP